MATSPAPAMPRFLKLGNSIVGTLIRSGLRIGPNVLLTVPGRKSGIPHTTPVAILEFGNQRFVQSPYGNVDWVKNLRAAKRGVITRRRHEEQIRAEEVSIEEAAPIYKNLMPSLPSILRKYFDIANDASLTDYAEMSRGHPMFRITTVTP